MGSFLNSNQDFLSEILRSFRKENGYTQQRIADYLGIDRSTYAKYETSRKPELDIIVQLAALYGVSVDEFLGDYSNRTIQGKNVKPFANAASPESEEAVELTREELRLLSLFRKSIRKNEILNYTRRIAAEDSNFSQNLKD